MKFFSKKMYLVVASLIILVDQAIKYYIINHFAHYKFNEYIAIDLVYNRGISWGLLHSDNSTIFACVNSAILFVIGMLLVHSVVLMLQHRCIIGEVMVFAGAFSNCIDRYYYSGVVDFIALSYQSWCFPVFNIADMFIVLGVITMFLFEWRRSA